jgi:hypothetical protein
LARIVEFRTKKQALAKIATWAAGYVNASSLDEILGYTGAEAELSPAEEERLEWAKMEVRRRLHKMGSD